MAIDWMKWGIFGAVAGLATKWVLGLVSTVLSWIPGVDVSLQSVSVTAQVSQAVDTSLGQFAAKLFGIIPGFTPADWMYAAIGGAAFVILGAYLVDMMNLNLAKTRAGKIATVLVVAGLASGIIVSMSINVPTLPALVTMAVDGLVIGFIAAKLDPKRKIVP